MARSDRYRLATGYGEFRRRDAALRWEALMAQKTSNVDLKTVVEMLGISPSELAEMRAAAGPETDDGSLAAMLLDNTNVLVRPREPESAATSHASVLPGGVTPTAPAPTVAPATVRPAAPADNPYAGLTMDEILQRHWEWSNTTTSPDGTVMTDLHEYIPNPDAALGTTIVTSTTTFPDGKKLVSTIVDKNNGELAELFRRTYDGDELTSSVRGTLKEQMDLVDALGNPVEPDVRAGIPGVSPSGTTTTGAQTPSAPPTQTQSSGSSPPSSSSTSSSSDASPSAGERGGRTGFEDGTPSRGSGSSGESGHGSSQATGREWTTVTNDNTSWSGDHGETTTHTETHTVEYENEDGTYTYETTTTTTTTEGGESTTETERTTETTEVPRSDDGSEEDYVAGDGYSDTGPVPAKVSIGSDQKEAGDAHEQAVYSGVFGSFHGSPIQDQRVEAEVTGAPMDFGDAADPNADPPPTPDDIEVPLHGQGASPHGTQILVDPDAGDTTLSPEQIDFASSLGRGGDYGDPNDPNRQEAPAPAENPMDTSPYELVDTSALAGADLAMSSGIDQPELGGGFAASSDAPDAGVGEWGGDDPDGDGLPG